MNLKIAILFIAGIAIAITEIKAQDVPLLRWDTLAIYRTDSVKSSSTVSVALAQVKDSYKRKGVSWLDNLKQSLSLKRSSGKDTLSAGKLWGKANPLSDLNLPKLSFRRPFQINNGYLAYNFDYRSNIDTPFSDKNVSQHLTNGRLGVTLFNAIPLNVSFFIRQSNSSLFADIHDVRVDFNSAQYAQQLRDFYLQRFNSYNNAIKDSLLSRLRQFNLSALNAVKGQINRPDYQQKLVEYNEIIQIPAIANSIAGPDKADSVRGRAKEFMAMYQRLKGAEEKYRQNIDSIQDLLAATVAKGKTLRERMQMGFKAGSSDEVFSLLKKEGIKVSRMERHLMAVRRFSLGRSPLNYSELTARNISMKGLNFEYNSWFYFALAAGVADYRFRDIIVSRANKTPQPMYLVRLGIGRLESNHIIFSAYKGRKQSYLYQSNSNGSRSLDIYGISAEVKYRLNSNNYIVAEVAESASPSFTVYDNPKSAELFDWKSKTNKAYSVKLYSYIPATKTRLEGFYRYTGAFFQSFDRFQSNSAQQYWYIKAEQYFWKRQLRVNAAIRSNEFSNPYISQQYSSNMIFKTMQVTLRKKGWPVISAGYMPSSQLTKIDNQLTENRFHTLNIIGWHQYKVGIQKLATTVGYNRFFNNAADSGFIYFNAVNFFIQNHIFFKKFSAVLGGSHSSNTGFELNVLEESFQFNIFKSISLGVGLKVNNYQRQVNKLGSWYRVSLPFSKTGWLQAQYDDGFIPTNAGQLVKNKFVGISINKSF